ncbi:MAG: gamma-glutamyltransferase family protein [Gammaproteobacteria bacterium]|nr:gamma-glutamyltransferase family protein [Gammaproteobacteria bacterium]
MVVTANPHASKAGAEILRAGGSAVDAAVAIEAVLSLVEPQSSGLAGGAFLSYYDAASKQVAIYDGRETAPASAHESMFLKDDGEPYGFLDAKTSGLSTGVPGAVAMLQLAHADHGQLPWAGLFDRAQQIAVDGFPISPRLQNFLERFGRFIPKTSEQGTTDAYRYFYDEKGAAWPVGHRLKNLEYAAALKIIAADPGAFYTGELARQIVQQTNIMPRAGGMTMADMAGYKALRKQALCTPYRKLQLCGPPPPSSWIAVGMTMGLLSQAEPFKEGGADNPLNWAVFTEAQRLAYADRDRFVADTDFAEVPLQGMLHPEYLAKRAALIDNGKADATIAAGDPWAYQQADKNVAGFDPAMDVAGTTHFVVVDHAGNVVSMTASVESIFGSTRMAGGMFLNNQLTDFSFRPKDDQGKPIANRAQAGKRPRSSMSPTIVLDEGGNFVMASGSPGGNSIIAYTAKTLVGVLDWGLSPQAAVDLPNLVARGDKVRIEQARASQALIAGLRDYGFDLKESSGENSGLSVVFRHPDGRLEGGVDPRREGIIEVVLP